MSHLSQQPWPVQGDSLPEPTVEQLTWLHQAAHMGRGSSSKLNSPPPPSQQAAQNLAHLPDKVVEEGFRILSALPNVPLNRRRQACSE